MEDSKERTEADTRACTSGQSPHDESQAEKAVDASHLALTIFSSQILQTMVLHPAEALSIDALPTSSDKVDHHLPSASEPSATNHGQRALKEGARTHSQWRDAPMASPECLPPRQARSYFASPPDGLLSSSSACGRSGKKNAVVGKWKRIEQTRGQSVVPELPCAPERLHTEQQVSENTIY